jgi:putative membrane protein
MRKTILIAVSALALTAACGQQATTTEVTPPPVAEAPPAPAQITNADFAQAVANTDAFEIQAAEIATQRGVRADIKEFARMMRTDHTATTGELTTLAPTLGLTAPTPALDADHNAKLEALRNASGEAFDDLCLDQQVQAHQDAINLFQSYLAGAPQDALRQWAEATLPKLRTHHERAQSLENAT